MGPVPPKAIQKTKPESSLRRLRTPSRLQPRIQLLPIPVQILHRLKRALEQQRHIVQNPLDDLLLPAFVKADLLVEPVLEPVRIRQARLHGVVGEQRLVDVQVGGVQGLRGARSEERRVGKECRL